MIRDSIYRFQDGTEFTGDLAYYHAASYKTNPNVGVYEYVPPAYENYIKVNAPKSICPYFWLLIASFILTLGAISIAFGAIGGVAWLVYAFILLVLKDPVSWAHACAIVFGALVVLWFLVRIVIMKGIPSFYGSARSLYPKQRQRTQTGFFYITKNFIQAKKNKVCPVIDFQD